MRAFAYVWSSPINFSLFRNRSLRTKHTHTYVHTHTYTQALPLSLSLSLSPSLSLSLSLSLTHTSSHARTLAGIHVTFFPFFDFLVCLSSSLPTSFFFLSMYIFAWLEIKLKWFYSDVVVSLFIGFFFLNSDCIFQSHRIFIYYKLQTWKRGQILASSLGLALGMAYAPGNCPNSTTLNAIGRYTPGKQVFWKQTLYFLLIFGHQSQEFCVLSVFVRRSDLFGVI